MPAIHDSWTGKANESLFKPFYEAARNARAELVQAGGDPYKAYKTRPSIALRLLVVSQPRPGALSGSDSEYARVHGLPAERRRQGRARWQRNPSLDRAKAGGRT